MYMAFFGCIGQSLNLANAKKRALYIINKNFFPVTYNIVGPSSTSKF